ncbi:ester cyclase [Chitinophaga japonensis]|uniref:Putative ester cyclase n=1 Tax=Chitinophaga japonensis TaxID=104662 RepID=A0A562TFF1_CHIJA|nr:ester cyclase [Chitinophaga japonensis]TWI92093.1 putative ester cyclase [Chitinophaga japonensis]
MRSTNTVLYLLLTAILLPGITAAQETSHINNRTKIKEDKMTTAQQNKEIVRAVYEQCLNKRNTALLQDYVSPDYTGAQGEKGPEGFMTQVAPILQGLPDIQWQIDELIAEDDKVAVKWHIEATHTGQLRNYAPTGKKVSNTGMAVYDMKDGKVVKTQLLTDALGFLQQLEVLPENLASLAAKKPQPDAVYFIDKFFVPAAGKSEFLERTGINRRFIKQLPGFVEDAVYEYTDEEGNLVCITVAQWESQEALDQAKAAVQEAYKKEGFDASAMMKRLHIRADRGVYTAADARQ